MSDPTSSSPKLWTSEISDFANECENLTLKGFGTYKIKEIDAIDSALKNGYNFLDTAELYKNELLVAEAIRNNSATNPEKGHERFLPDGTPLYVSTKISFNAIKKQKIEKSFYKRLAIFEGIKLNIILLHQPSDDCKRDWDILCELYSQNRDKVEYIGVSNYKLEHLMELKDCPIQPFCNQFELNPFYLQKDVVDYCRDSNVKIISHTTLTQGLRLDEPKLVEISRKYQVSVARLLLRWAHQHNYITIPKTCILEELLDNLELGFEIRHEDIKILNDMNEDYCLIKLPYIKPKPTPIGVN